MAKKEVNVCDYCGKVIDDHDSVIIQGNLGVLQNCSFGGLIGNNIVTDDFGNIIKVVEQDFCLACFFKNFNEEILNNMVLEINNILPHKRS